MTSESAAHPGRAELRSPRDAGAGSIVVVAITAVFALLAALVVPIAGAFGAQQRADAAADAAALAAADTLSGRVPGYPCENAARLAAENGAELSACETSDLIATVAVSVRYLGFDLRARARAGPPREG